MKALATKLMTFHFSIQILEQFKGLDFLMKLINSYANKNYMEFCKTDNEPHRLFEAQPASMKLVPSR